MEHFFSEDDARKMPITEIRQRFYMLYAHYTVHSEEKKREVACKPPMSPSYKAAWIDKLILELERNYAETGRPTIGFIREFMGLWAQAIKSRKDDAIEAFGEILDKYSENSRPIQPEQNRIFDISAKSSKEHAELAAELAEIKKHTEGVPPLVADARNETNQAWRLSRKMLELLEFDKPENAPQKTVYIGNCNGKTQAEIAKEMKVSIRTVKRLSTSVNTILQRAKMPPMIWNDRKSPK